MNSLRNLFMAIPLLSLVGCGCVGDEGGFSPSPNVIRPFVVGTRVTPIPVQVAPGKIRIDVFFLMDDSGFNPNGVPANQPGFVYGDISYFPTQPGRKKQQAARAIFANIVDQLDADLAAAFPADQFDIAYGVGRYEDFGGPFRTDDKNARPFILNQPILREGRADFLPTFTDALNNRTAPGGGNNRTAFIEPQSIVEALFQIGAGTGFDADGGGISGTFGDIASQTAPDLSGDVPAASFTLSGAPDDDGEQQFTTSVGGVLSSGNLGGVGWRRDALRYVITTSDISGVVPVVADANITVPPAPSPITGFVRNTAGAAGYPRTQRDVNIQSFATIPGNQTQQATARMGLPGGTVSPANAHTVQDSIVALNTGVAATNGGQNLNIEVLSIGTLRTAPIPYKPNDGPPTPLGEVEAITPAQLANPAPLQQPAPAGAPPDQSPFTWMSAYATLTGALRPWPTAADPLLPLVYNLTTVSPSAGNVNANIREDLVYRIGEAKGTLPPGGVAVTTPVPYTFALSINTGVGTPFFIGAVDPVDSDGAATTVNVVGSNIQVNVPRYVPGVDPVPATIEIFWIVQIGLLDPFRDTPANDNLPFSITASTAPAVPPNPAKGPHTGTIFYSAPLPSATRVGSAALANMTAGCAFVALGPPDAPFPPPFTDRTDLGVCP